MTYLFSFDWNMQAQIANLQAYLDTIKLPFSAFLQEKNQMLTLLEQAGVNMIKLQQKDGIRGYTDGSIWVPSVHAVLDVLEGNGKFLAEELTATGIGCHKAMWEHFQTGRYPTDPLILRRIIPILDWMGEEGWSVKLSEVPMISPLGYGGTPDVLLQRAEEFLLVDFKFAESLLSLYTTQLAAYLHLFQPPLRRGAILKVNKVGILKIKYIHDIKEEFQDFLAALRVLRRRMR